MITEPLFYLVAIPAVFLLGLSKSGFGAGFGSLGVPLMALAVPVPQAVAIMLPLLLIMDALGLKALWHERDAALLRLLVPAGLLGTVIGMIEIFGAQAPTGGVTMGGANPVQLAHGISVALYNTAFGLIVAIPSLIFWRYFRAQVDSYLLTMELASDRFARHLNNLRSK